MPKPGSKYNNSNLNNKQHNNDGRGENDGNVRRVWFKNNKFGRKGPQKDWTKSVRGYLEDEDVDMGGLSFEGGGRGARRHQNSSRRPGGRQGSPAPRKNFNRSKLLESFSNWYRINLPYGNKYDKDFLVTTLRSLVDPIPFIPYCWSSSNSHVNFFVEGHKLAEKLHEIDRQIECPDGFKLTIRVRGEFPSSTITATMKEKMKVAMEGRFNSAGKALDLSSFHTDPNLLDFFCALAKADVMLAVIDIISENIPELEALKLDDNSLRIFGHLRRLKYKLPNLKILYLANNRIKSLHCLEPLRGLPLIELVLHGNPLCNNSKERTVYISDVRKLFPKVMKLDGIDLEPPIVFDVEEEIPLPVSQQTFLCDQKVKNTVHTFLMEYFNCFDSDNRLQLLPAYHENAVLSMTMHHPTNQSKGPWLSWYKTDNRNLLKLTELGRREKLLKQGNQTIVEFLKDMPNTKHDFNSFTVDVPWSMRFILMTVTGLFKEFNDKGSGYKNPPIRSFCRTMVIVQINEGFCILNEEIHISNASEEEVKTAFKAPVVVTPQVQSPAQATVSPATAAVVSPNIDANIKQQMVVAMSQQSGMNLVYSTQCLEGANWDFNQAAIMYTAAKEAGRIPPDAYLP